MIIALIFLLLLTCYGIILIRSLLSEDRWFILIPAGSFLAVSVYIFLLNLNYHFFPGSFGIVLSNFEIFFLSLFCLMKFRKSWTKTIFTKDNQTIFLIILIIICFSLSALRMVNTLTMSDSAIQWAYAASFSRGNYPLMVPWQSDITPNYHLGAYFFEGSLQYLSNLSFTATHALINTFFFANNLLFSIFLFWKGRNLLQNLPLVGASLILFISFGIITTFYPNPNFSNHLQIISPANLDKLLALIPAKQPNGGAPLVDLNFLSYLPARSLSIGLAFLVIYLAFAKFNSGKIRLLVISFVISTIAFIEEAMFLPLILTIAVLLCLSIFSFVIPLSYFKQHRMQFFLILITTILFSVLQGGFVFHNLFETQKPVFRILSPYSNFFIERMQYLGDVNITNFNGLNWYVPNPLWLLVITLVYSLYTKDKLLGLFCLFSAMCFFLFLSVEHIYCSGCSYRFHSFGYLSLGYAFTLMLIFIYQKLKQPKKNFFLACISIFIVIPTLLPTFLSETKLLNKYLQQNTSGNMLRASLYSASPQDRVIAWAHQNLPKNSRVVILDKDYPSPQVPIGFEYGGIYTTYGPSFISSYRQEPGPEFFDLSLSLNPQFFNLTKTKYLYIESESPAYKQLPDLRRAQLQNTRYFKPLIKLSDKNPTGENFYDLYQVTDTYLNSPEIGYLAKGMINDLQKLIPSQSTVYIDDYPKLSFWYRMALSLALRDRGLALTRRDKDNIEFRTPYSGYMLIEANFKTIEDRHDNLYDYYLLSPDSQPKVASQLIWKNVFASAWKRITK